MRPKTPPFGLQAISDRVSVVEANDIATGERLARVETKVDLVVDLLVQERTDRAVAAAQNALTERERISSRAKIIVAVLTALGVIATAYAGLA